ncbi:hypothetical protein B296_00043374 [Ensete ventricosum]|uniref:Uncharacterized protein n=1 Tax=Ensete ventricosum TaxID=4639 RepID=A0A426YQY0_ENSVE|nr:hypothetical protein B296_00043374 [Ensete ventricosum]
MAAKENGEEREDLSSELEKDIKHGKDGESDYEPAKDSLSSHGETPGNDDRKAKRASRVPKKLAEKETVDNSPRISPGNANHQEHGRLHFRTSNTSQKKSQKPGKAAVSPKNLSHKKLDNTNISSKPSSQVSEETANKAVEEVKEIDEAPVCDHSNGTDDETVDTEENVLDDDSASVYQKIEEMESRIEKLEEELREVAALEISLYSVIPVHGSSAHKVHTPARRLSRPYIHACLQILDPGQEGHIFSPMQSILERRVSDKEVTGGIPCAAAAPVVYLPPSADDVAEKVGDVGGKAELERRGSMVQRKGYTSDEDVDVLDTPLAHIMDKTPAPLSPSPAAEPHEESSTSNSRYNLLREEVWCV